MGKLSLWQMHEVELLAQQHPEIRAEIARTHTVLLGLSTDKSVLRVQKENILHTLHQLRIEQEMSLDQLPLLNPYSDYRRWLAVVAPLGPTHHLEEMDLCILQETPSVLQTLIWMKTAVEEDGHDPDNFQESFLVLAGECECNVGGSIARLGAGDYLAIPPNTQHTIRNLHIDQPLLGVIQRYRGAM